MDKETLLICVLPEGVDPVKLMDFVIQEHVKDHSLNFPYASTKVNLSMFLSSPQVRAMDIDSVTWTLGALIEGQFK